MNKHRYPHITEVTPGTGTLWNITEVTPGTGTLWHITEVTPRDRNPVTYHRSDPRSRNPVTYHRSDPRSRNPVTYHRSDPPGQEPCDISPKWPPEQEPCDISPKWPPEQEPCDISPKWPPGTGTLWHAQQDSASDEDPIMYSNMIYRTEYNEHQKIVNIQTQGIKGQKYYCASHLDDSTGRFCWPNHFERIPISWKLERKKYCYMFSGKFWVLVYKYWQNEEINIQLNLIWKFQANFHMQKKGCETVKKGCETVNLIIVVVVVILLT